MEAVKRINKDNVKLIVFGSVIKEPRDKVNTLSDLARRYYILVGLMLIKLIIILLAADLVVFPGRHPVFLETGSRL